MSIEPHLLILQVVVPLLGAVLSAFVRRGTIAWAFATIVTWLTFALSAWILWKVTATGETLSYVMGGWKAPWGIEYRVDTLNAFVLFVVTSVGAVSMPFARRSVAFEIDSSRQAWFYTMYLMCLAGLLGMAVSGDAFNIFVFMEISSLASYVLIALGRDRRALLSAYQYLIIGTIGATLYVIGVALLYLVTGSLNVADIAARLGPASAEFTRPVLAALAFITVGVCLKLALFPLHLWLPNAYAFAPSFATAFLAGTATKVAIYLLIRFFFTVFGPTLDDKLMLITDILLVLSVLAMFICSISAVYEDNAKRMLAYSSVAQIGYITLGIALLNTSGLTGGIVHLFNHAVTKTGLFLVLGAIAYRVGSLKLSDYAGLGRKMPWTMAAFVVGGFSLIGVPGTAGFISKWYLALGALESGYWIILVLLVLSSLIAVVYVWLVVEVAYFREPSAAMVDARDPPASMMVPILVLAAATIYFGFDTRISAEIAANAAQALIGGLK